MRTRSAIIAAALVAIAAALPPATQAQERRPAIPRDQGVRLVGRVGFLPYRCAEAPVTNFYHDALYDQPPAVYRGFAYRPYYRYTAWHIVPRTYVCAE